MKIILKVTHGETTFVSAQDTVYDILFQEDFLFVFPEFESYLRRKKDFHKEI